MTDALVTDVSEHGDVAHGVAVVVGAANKLGALLVEVLQFGFGFGYFVGAVGEKG